PADIPQASSRSRRLIPRFNTLALIPVGIGLRLALDKRKGKLLRMVGGGALVLSGTLLPLLSKFRGRRPDLNLRVDQEAASLLPLEMASAFEEGDLLVRVRIQNRPDARRANDILRMSG